MRILITGATGLIGKELGKELALKGHQITVVSRDGKKARESLPFPCDIIVGDLTKGKLEDPRLDQIEAVINLMGEPVVGGRWNDEVKQRIYDSRVLSTRNLVASVIERKSPIEVFISGSAIGFYGSCGNDICDENRDSGKDFLAKVTVDWEKEAELAPGRVCLVRTGIVLSLHGGALQKMLFPFKAGVGGVLGDGQQWMSWIHIDDIVGMFIFALENKKVSGPINGVAPNPVTNKVLSNTLASNLGKKLAVPVPRIALKSVYGEGANTILSSIRCSTAHIVSLGYKFKFDDIGKALEQICKPFEKGDELFYSEQYLPLPPEQVFAFFKDPYNLERLTPPSLKFNVKAISTPEIEQGTLIDYVLKIHSVPAKWRTLIDEWSPPHKFVDTSLNGPYRVWHHTHEFKPFCGGTLMTDSVRYQIPMGYLGWILAGGIVRHDVEGIFKYRRQFIAQMYYS
jgi:hypothetical protein